jgi:hypothetical protein
MDTRCISMASSSTSTSRRRALTQPADIAILGTEMKGLPIALGLQSHGE